jgi:hypothetical protein
MTIVDCLWLVPASKTECSRSALISGRFPSRNGQNHSLCAIALPVRNVRRVTIGRRPRGKLGPWSVDFELWVAIVSFAGTRFMTHNLRINVQIASLFFLSSKRSPIDIQNVLNFRSSTERNSSSNLSMNESNLLVINDDGKDVIAGKGNGIPRDRTEGVCYHPLATLVADIAFFSMARVTLSIEDKTPYRSTAISSTRGRLDRRPEIATRGPRVRLSTNGLLQTQECVLNLRPIATLQS